MDEIILIGAGGHAVACIDVIELSGKYKIAGLVEKDGAVYQNDLGYPILGLDNDLPSLRNKYDNLLALLCSYSRYRLMLPMLCLSSLDAVA